MLIWVISYKLIHWTLSLGKTAEAKSDLARLQEVRARREAAAAQRKAEAEGESTSYKTLSPSS